MDKNTIMQIAQSDPQFSRIIDAIEQQIGDMPVTPGDLDEAIKLLEFVLQNPDKYQEVVAAAVKDGVVGADEIPPEFDAVFIISMLAAFYSLRDRLEQKEFKRGGLAKAARRLQAAGRGGDTMLAHINPREAEILRRMGGDGSVNPMTGLTEYKSVKKIFKAILPIALNFIAPGLGSAIGSTLGLSGTAAAVVGNAVLQGGTAALTGGDPLKAAIMGGVTGGLGGVAGSAANKALGLNLGTAGQNILGSAITGAGASALTGGNVLQGALQGAGGQLLAGKIGQYGPNVGAGAQSAANMLASGYKPREAVAGGVLSGLMNKFLPKDMFAKKPSDTVVDQIKQPAIGEQDLSMFSPEYSAAGQAAMAPQYDAQQLAALGYSPQEIAAMNVQTGAASIPGTPATPAAPTAAAAPAAPSGGATAPKSPFSSMGNIGTLALLSSALSSAPPQVQEAVSSLSPAQQEYFNRPSITWDWNKLQADANKANLTLNQFMARYWPNIVAGNYNVNTPVPAGTATGGGMAHGGALTNVARMARGAGSGRADTIDAKLSDGEYVMDAETVAMLGDGSTDEGARRLDEMRKNLREHKGKSLAKGKFSPNAKSPLAYIKEIA